MSLVGKVLGMLMERQGRGASMGEWAERLTQSADGVAERIAGASDTPKNRDVAAHIIGIKRWGQRRLRILLGEPLVRDEYDGYRPATSEGVSTLAQTFRQTRVETVGLVRLLQAEGCGPEAKAPHNDLGETSVLGWLSYLNGHAAMESRKLR